MRARDSRGRRRTAGQERGLRPLFPELPGEWISRAIRIAMPARSWAELDARVSAVRPGTVTGARAAGEVLIALMSAEARLGRSAGDWLDFEREKAWRLLGHRRAA